MIFELKQKKDGELELMYNRAIKELNLFYKIKWKKSIPNIILLNSRKEINNFKFEKTPSWLVGWANENIVYLLDRKSYEKESSHEYSKEKYYLLLKHELSHLFFDKFSNSNTLDQFIWLNEGVAGCLSEQFKEKPKKFEKFLDQYSNWNGNAYNESSYAIKFLREKFGDKKLRLLIKSLYKIKSEEDFRKLFQKIYGEKPSYKFFNSLL